MPSVDASAQFVAVSSNELHTTSSGVAGRLGWMIGRWVSVEGEIAVHPGELGDGAAFSAGMLEGFFGATIGPRIGRARPFGRVRPGFVRFQPAPAPIPCLAIFPPPLVCAIAAGTTVFAFDLGGGVEVSTTPRSFLRVDVGDRITRFRGPVFDSQFTVRDKSLLSHGLRIAAGAGVRF